MPARSFELRRVIVIATAALAFSVKAEAFHRYPVSETQLREAIAKVRIGKCLEYEHDGSKPDDCRNLSELTRDINPGKVSDKTIADLASLLNTEDDYVRMWVAASLGHFGARAKFSAPKLLEILNEVDCLYQDLNSAATIRPALRKMGVKPPTPTCPLNPSMLTKHSSSGSNSPPPAPPRPAADDAA